MRVEHEHCDNPHCSVKGMPEGTDTPPYGWVHAHVDLVGCGPDVTVAVHALSCLGPALESAFEEKAREDGQ